MKEYIYIYKEPCWTEAKDYNALGIFLMVSLAWKAKSFIMAKATVSDHLSIPRSPKWYLSYLSIQRDYGSEISGHLTINSECWLIKGREIYTLSDSNRGSFRNPGSFNFRINKVSSTLFTLIFYLTFLFKFPLLFFYPSLHSPSPPPSDYGRECNKTTFTSMNKQASRLTESNKKTWNIPIQGNKWLFFLKKFHIRNGQNIPSLYQNLDCSNWVSFPSCVSP